jgi:hypothetical protein
MGDAKKAKKGKPAKTAPLTPEERAAQKAIQEADARLAAAVAEQRWRDAGRALDAASVKMAGRAGRELARLWARHQAKSQTGESEATTLLLRIALKPLSEDARREMAEALSARSDAAGPIRMLLRKGPIKNLRAPAGAGSMTRFALEHALQKQSWESALALIENEAAARKPGEKTLEMARPESYLSGLAKARGSEEQLARLREAHWAMFGPAAGEPASMHWEWSAQKALCAAVGERRWSAAAWLAGRLDCMSDERCATAPRAEQLRMERGAVLRSAFSLCDNNEGMFDQLLGALSEAGVSLAIGGRHALAGAMSGLSRANAGEGERRLAALEAAGAREASDQGGEALAVAISEKKRASKEPERQIDKAIELLVDWGAVSENPAPAMCLAASANPDRMPWLFGLGARLEQAEHALAHAAKSRVTVISMTNEHQPISAFEWLLDNASPSPRALDGALSGAAAAGLFDRLERLLAAGASLSRPQAPTEGGPFKSPLEEAAAIDSEGELTAWLIANGADARGPKKDGAPLRRAWEEKKANAALVLAGCGGMTLGLAKAIDKAASADGASPVPEGMESVVQGARAMVEARAIRRDLDAAKKEKEIQPEKPGEKAGRRIRL